MKVIKIRELAANITTYLLSLRPTPMIQGSYKRIVIKAINWKVGLI